MSEQLYTTKRLLRKYHACAERYRHLLNALGPTPDNTPIPLVRILETNGLDDALWALRAVPAKQRTLRDRLARLFACRCVRETPLGDGRTMWDELPADSRRAVETAERYAVGDATENELASARPAARSAAWDAAWGAARSAAWDAARSAAWDAARDAAWDAARSAAWDAARDAARSAAWDAAWGAARSAAWDAARGFQARLFAEMFGGEP